MIYSHNFWERKGSDLIYNPHQKGGGLKQIQSSKNSFFFSERIKHTQLCRKTNKNYIDVKVNNHVWTWLHSPNKAAVVVAVAAVVVRCWCRNKYEEEVSFNKL